jgi:TatD DNase family protein
VVARARNAGVGLMQTIGTRLSTFPKLLDIARRHEGVCCSVGVHPHEAGGEGLDDPAPLLAYAGDPAVIGIGESGLDYFYDHAPRDRQAASFKAHIRAAQVSGLPLIVHTRDADDDTASMLEAAMAERPFRGVIHCYSSTPELARRAVAIGFYLGIGGILTFKRSDELRATVKAMPRDRLLLETDSPYLAPVPKRGRPNEPAYIPFIAAVLAEVLEIDTDAVARLTTENFHRLFTKAPRGAGAA